jgi:hypothetical protein
MTQPQPTAALSDAQLIDAIEAAIGDCDIRTTYRQQAEEIAQAVRRLTRAESAPGVSRERLAQIIQPFTPSYVIASKCADAVLAAMNGTDHA